MGCWLVDGCVVVDICVTTLVERNNKLFRINPELINIHDCPGFYSEDYCMHVHHYSEVERSNVLDGVCRL